MFWHVLRARSTAFPGVLTAMSAANVAAVFGAVFALAGCTEFEPGTDERSPDETVVEQQQAAFGHDWSCLHDADTPVELLSSPVDAPRLVQSVRLLSLASGQVIPGIAVRACEQRDVECTRPLTDSIPVAADGWVDVPLYEGFDGFLEITAPTVLSTALFYADPLTPGTEVDRTPLGLVESALLPALSGATGTPQSSDLGLVVLRSFDCQGVAAPGITFSIDKPGARWYFVGELPSSTAVETTDSGLGGFINVPPGIAVVNAELPGATRQIATPQTVLVRPNWMTAMRFVPSLE